MFGGEPEDLDRCVMEAMNAGDIDGLVSLYEPQATLTPAPGNLVTGLDAIRESFGPFIALKPTLTLTPRKLAETGDIALTCATWELTGTGPDGSPVRMSGNSVEVCRRQPDGRWLFVIDNPHGLELGETS